MKKWKILSDKIPESPQELQDILLANRNLRKEEIQAREKDLNTLTPDDVGIDSKEMEMAVKRIEEAVVKDEQIIVFGDYDADGICATTILWEVLYKRSKKTMPYLPDRKSEGYGLSSGVIDNILKKHPDIRLIVTVDNGIVATEAVDYAKKNGIDVIISDHHTKGEKYPDATAVVYTTQLCGAGVAWMLAKEIARERDMEKELDLVAIAAIADLVPLTGINRALVKKGLEYLNTTQRIGLKELVSEARIQNRKIGVYDIGFLIAPRLNAAGRVGHAIESLRLLCTKSHDNARIFAGKLGAQNRKRQLVTDNLTLHAKKEMKKYAKEKRVLFAHHPTYDEGIIGLIASKLVEEYYLPSIAVAQGEDISKGSARSISGVNIIEMIQKAEKYVEGAGGHPMAAGFVVKTKKLKDFKKAIEEAALATVTDDLLQRELKIDTLLPPAMIDFPLHTEIQSLYPFGIGNPEPTFVSKDVIVKKFDFVGKDGSHLRLTIEKDGKEIETIGFGLAPMFKNIVGDTIDIVYTIDINEWRGRRKINLKLKDFQNQ